MRLRTGRVSDGRQWTIEAGKAAWFLYNLDTGRILGQPEDIVAFIRSTPETLRRVALPEADLRDVRLRVEKHIKNTYLKQVKAPRGAKAGLVIAAIRRQPGDFPLSDIERACPGVGREWIRTLLTDLKAAGEVSCQGRGPAARRRYLGSKGIEGGINPQTAQ